MNSGESPIWEPLLIALLSATVVAVLGGLATDIGPWYRALNKPSWQPPDWLFGPVWTLIFGLAGLSAALAWRSAEGGASREIIVLLFLANAFFNVLWSVLFFRLKRPDWALAEAAPLWLSVLLPMIFVAHYSRLSSLLLAPYLLWVAFAIVLNYKIVRLNPKT
jgi:translocator protein